MLTKLMKDWHESVTIYFTIGHASFYSDQNRNTFLLSRVLKMLNCKGWARYMEQKESEKRSQTGGLPDPEYLLFFKSCILALGSLVPCK